MKYYIDCEFDGHNGPLLSMALVRNDQNNIMIISGEGAGDPWVAENVIPVLHCDEAAVTIFARANEAGRHIRAFLEDDKAPIIVADSPVDIARFCQAISTADDGGYHQCFAPNIMFEVHDVDCYPTTLPGAVQHNAWWDAMALRRKLTQGMSASGQDPQGLEAKPASPVPQGCATQDTPNPEPSHV